MTVTARVTVTFSDMSLRALFAKQSPGSGRLLLEDLPLESSVLHTMRSEVFAEFLGHHRFVIGHTGGNQTASNDLTDYLRLDIFR